MFEKNNKKMKTFSLSVHCKTYVYIDKKKHVCIYKYVKCVTFFVSFFMVQYYIKKKPEIKLKKLNSKIIKLLGNFNN